MTPLADKLQQLEQMKGETQKAVWTALQMKKDDYLSFQASAIPALEQIKQIADHFDVSIDWLLDRQCHKGILESIHDELKKMNSD